MSPTSPLLMAHRDERIVEGRAERSGETYYVVPGCALSATATQALSANVDYYTGWRVATPVVVDQMAFEVNSTGTATNARIGFYRADRDWQPYGAPLADSGDVAVGTTGVKTYTPSTPILVRPGRYLSVTNANGTVTLRAIDGGGNAIDSALGTSWSLGAGSFARSYAAFPTPPSAWDTQSFTTAVGFRHFVVYRLSQP